MTIKRTRLVAGILSAMLLSTTMAMALVSSLIFTNLRGTLHVVQGLPCGDPVDLTTSVADGRMEITFSPPPPADAIGRGVLFTLTRMDMFFTPFTVQRECFGLNVKAEFREIGVQLVDAVRFIGEPAGAPGHFRFSIPRSKVLIFESVLDNLPVKQPETAYQRPSEDVTGEIDLGRHTAQLHIALNTTTRFQIGCVRNKCVIDEVRGSKQTVDVSGIEVSPATDSDSDTIPDLMDNCPLVSNRTQLPVATPVLTAPADLTVSSCAVPNLGTAEAIDVCRARPVAITNNAPATFAVGRNVVTWKASDGIDPVVTAPQVVTVSAADRTPPAAACRTTKPQFFQVVASDDCAGPTTIKLGSFSLTSGETIHIEQTGKPGVRLINTVGNDQVKHFLVGKGEALIVSTDASGNAASAACK